MGGLQAGASYASYLGKPPPDLNRWKPAQAGSLGGQSSPVTPSTASLPDMQHSSQ